MRAVIVNDINYLCLKLEAANQLSVKAILMKVINKVLSTFNQKLLNSLLLRTPHDFI